MRKGKTALIAASGFGSALLAAGVFVLVRSYSGGTLVAVMAGGFVALILPIVAVMVLLPKLTGESKN